MIRSFGLVVFIGITRMALQTLCKENRKRCQMLAREARRNEPESRDMRR
jgi:hypothetical protein